jgi:hypothetical protein
VGALSRRLTRIARSFIEDLSMHSRWLVLPALVVIASSAAAQDETSAVHEACDIDDVPGMVWHGRTTRVPLDRLAAYLAPVFWFSPDEPSLARQRGADIRIPEPFPAEGPADHPVVYYQFTRVLERSGHGPVVLDRSDPDNPVLDLDRAAGFELSFYAYFREELGLGAHPHDIEPAEFRAVILRGDDDERLAYRGCTAEDRVVYVTRSTGKAHGLIWFWNVLETDGFTKFPMNLLVEEGKHALATDKNADGIFTPGFDVNRRVNDAWGVRDIIATGTLYGGGFQQWMAKVRRPEYRVLPPLPEDSDLRDDLADQVGDAVLATYELRRFPGMSVVGGDQALARLMAGHVVKDAPEVVPVNSLKEIGEFAEEGAALKSLSVAFRYDGYPGVSFVFPFFIIKNLEDPLAGGYIMQRMYFTGPDLEDFGWMALYTPSASRWFDTYVAAGAEWGHRQQDGSTVNTTDFVLEGGVKFRVNVLHSPFKVLGKLTPYWGLRAGIKNTGAFKVNEIGYVLEFGAGSF